MTCPFLKEAQVKYCRTSAIRKFIPLAKAGRAEERCSSDGYLECPVFQQQPDARETAAFGSCPFLHESLMQYCGAAPVTRFVPYSESLLSRCGNDSHRYCELYLSMAHPERPPEAVEGIAVPKDLRYTANHMWLDVSEDGAVHAGIDAFLGRVLGQVDRISYVWQQGQHHPTAVVTVAGADLQVTVPFPVLLTGCNLYLRADPSRLTSAPYSAGWLFEGRLEPGTMEHLIDGEDARPWMVAEVYRMNEFVKQIPGPAGATAADGGVFSAGVVRYVERDQMLALFHEFFSPFASRK